MNKASKFTLSVLIQLSTFACNTQVPNVNPNNDGQLASAQQRSANVSVNLNNLFARGFNIKAFDLSKAKKLQLEVIARDINTPITSQVVSYIPGQSSTLNVLVNPGKNRVVTLYLLDDNNYRIGSLSGVVEVKPGVDNPATISYFETAVAEIVLILIKSPNHNLLNTSDVNISFHVNLLRAYITHLTGYDKSSNTFTKLDPSQLNSLLIANNIIANNGNILM